MSASQASASREVIFEAVQALARTCESELEHTQHVTFLALRLFDQLQDLHRLTLRERDWLEVAGLLHDIGWVEGWQGHHKTSLRIILSTSMLPFDSKERLVIGSIARYHRRAEPSEEHDHFVALEPEERRVVVMLSAILRLADGLDRQHQMLVKDVACKVTSKTLRLTCEIGHHKKSGIEFTADKASLFEQVFNRKIKIIYKSKS